MAEMDTPAPGLAPDLRGGMAGLHTSLCHQHAPALSSHAEMQPTEKTSLKRVVRRNLPQFWM
jgi:hypothetical protein